MDVSLHTYSFWKTRKGTLFPNIQWTFVRSFQVSDVWRKADFCRNI
jgi:hypothetical protein